VGASEGGGARGVGRLVTRARGASGGGAGRAVCMVVRGGAPGVGAERTPGGGAPGHLVIAHCWRFAGCAVAHPGYGVEDKASNI
jgi:hypothetical protein